MEGLYPLTVTLTKKDGLRTGKTITSGTTTETVEYVYENGLLLQMRYNHMIFNFSYDANGSPVSMAYYSTPTSNPIYYYYALNSQGDVVGLYNSTGSLYAKYTYDAYGNLISLTNGSGSPINTKYSPAKLNPLRYRGYVYDTETGFYYLQSRYYDPTTCRFINADGEMSGYNDELLGNNLYIYCFNNPINMKDHSGGWAKWITGALNVVGGVAQIAAGVALGTFAGWTGVGAVAAVFLIANGGATAAQGVGQIVNHVTNSNTMREDNIIRTSVTDVARDVGGEPGEKIAEAAYDTVVTASSFYAGFCALEQVAMPKVVESKVFSINNGYGFKVGKNIEMLYRNPNAAGGTGGTVFSYNGPLGKYRIDWDPKHGFHSHPPGHQ